MSNASNGRLRQLIVQVVQAFASMANANSPDGHSAIKHANGAFQ